MKSFRIVVAIAALALASLACQGLSLPGGDTSLLKDDFSDTSSGWGTGTDDKSSVEYAGSGLQVKVFKDNYFIWTGPNQEKYENVHIEATANNNSSNQDTALGIYCDQQTITSAFYYFAMTPNGQYAIAEASVALSDVFLTNNDDWADSDAITKNAKSYRIGADCGNGKLTFYVDGKQIASVSDSSYTAGKAGLFVWSPKEINSAEVLFDDFVSSPLK